MGNKNNKTGEKTKDELLIVIGKVNSITQDILFMNKTKLYIEFSFDNNIIDKIFTDKIVKANVYSNLQNIKYFQKEVKLNVSQIYDFYDCLMTSLYLFFQNKVNEQNAFGKKNDEDEDSATCPICNKDNINMSLPCNHFFCLPCIEKWVLDKNNSCPLCRMTVNVNQDANGGKFESNEIVVINKEDPIELNKTNEKRLEDLLSKLFR